MLEGIVQTINSLENFFGRMKAETLDVCAARFDALRSTSFLDRLELLKESDDSNEYKVIDSVSRGWYVEYGEDRKEATVMIARDDDDLRDALRSKTHVRINGEVYSVTKSDTLPPVTMQQPYWKLVCRRYSAKRDLRSAG